MADVSLLDATKCMIVGWEVTSEMTVQTVLSDLEVAVRPTTVSRSPSIGPTSMPGAGTDVCEAARHADIGAVPSVGSATTPHAEERERLRSSRARRWPGTGGRKGRLSPRGRNRVVVHVVVELGSRARSETLSRRPEPRTSSGPTLQKTTPPANQESTARSLQGSQGGPLQQRNIAPVDLAQAAIGPGMAVSSCYATVLEPTGEPMPVRSALALINQVLDEVLAEQEGEFDAATRFAIKWFEQYGFEEADYDPAEGLARAMNVSVKGLEDARILVARTGQVRLLRRSELTADWDPATDTRMLVWEVTQQLVRALWDEGSEAKAGDLLRRLGGVREVARDLAYRLSAICERRGWAEDALGFNALVTSWPEIARRVASAAPVQQELA